MISHYQTLERPQNVNLSESKLMPAKQESDIKYELTYSGKERTNSDLTTQDTHSEDYRQDSDQSLSDSEFQGANLKGFLPGTLLQDKVDQRSLGTYIKSLIGKLEEIYSMLPEKNAVADFPQDIVTKFSNAMESVNTYLKNQEKDKITLPLREDSLKVDSLNSYFDINQEDSIDMDETNGHLESRPVQIRSESCNLNDTNLSDFKNPQCLKVIQDPTGLHEILKQENEKPQDYISKAEIMLSTNPHEEVIPVRKSVSAPNDKNRDSECLTTNSRRTCLKKQESKHIEPAYKTVTFMDPNPAGAMAERFKLKPGQIGKSPKKPMRRVLGNAGWD